MDAKSPAGQPAGFLRRLAALFYDLLLVAALSFAATFAMLPLNRGEAILPAAGEALAQGYRAALVLVVFGYFGASWMRSGQTLGMKAWRIELCTDAGGRLGWTGAIARFLLGGGMALLAAIGAFQLRRPASPLAAAGAAVLLAPLTLNFAWILVDASKRSLQDLAGGARVLRLPLLR